MSSFQTPHITENVVDDEQFAALLKKKEDLATRFDLIRQKKGSGAVNEDGTYDPQKILIEDIISLPLKSGFIATDQPTINQNKNALLRKLKIDKTPETDDEALK